MKAKSNRFSSILRMAALSLAVLCLCNMAAWTVFAQPIPGYAGPLSPQPYAAAPNTDYGWFERFRIDNFSPETEPLLQQALGTQLAFRAEGDWEYSSYTSCAVAFSTTLPAVSIIQYGTDASYGLETQTEDAYYFNHLHYLSNLQPNTVYHYRLVAQTKDGTQIVSEDRVFTTRTLASDVIRIPQDMPGSAPYQLTVPNKTYLLTQDIAVDGTFARINADNVTLDLGGNTVVYDNASGAPGRNVPCIMHGQDVWHKRNVKIVNGMIKQGQRGSAASAPIEFTQFYFPEGNTITGVTVDYYGADTKGFNLGGVTSVDHNVLIDRGTVVSNRHIGIHALSGTIGRATWNSFRRFRHQGIIGTGLIHDNELYCDSYDTNSYLITPQPNTEVYNNKLFGVGYMPLGLNYATNLNCHDNIIYLHGTANRPRSSEYNRLSGLTGISVRLYNPSIDGYDGNIGAPVENLRYERNIVILKPWENCNIARGLWFMTGDRSTNTVFKDNIVKVEALSDHLYNGNRWELLVTCVDVFGAGTSPAGPDGLPPVTLLEGNTFISNVSFISFGSSYGSGIDNVLFSRTTLEKIGHHTANYLPFTIGFWDWKSVANKLLNTIAGPGVDMAADPRFYGSGVSDMTIWNTYPLRFVDQFGNPVANTAVSIEVSGSWTYRATNGGAVPPGNVPAPFDPRYEFTTVTNGQGAVDIDFLEINHFMRKPNVAERADYTSAVFSADGYQPATVMMDEIRTHPQITMQTTAVPNPTPPPTPTPTPTPTPSPTPDTEPVTDKSLGKPGWVWVHGYSTTCAQVNYSCNAPSVLEIHRAGQPDGPYALVGRTDGSQYGAYLDGNLTPGQTYHYQLRIYKNDGLVGSFTQPQTVTIPLPAVTWSWIRQGAGSLNGNVYINWNSWHDVDYCNVLRATDINGPYEAINTLAMNKDFMTAIPTKSQPYYYKLQPVKNGVAGNATDPVRCESLK